MRAIWYDRQGPAREVLVAGELPTPAPERGEAVRLAAESRDAHLFDPESGERLPA